MKRNGKAWIWKAQRSAICLGDYELDFNGRTFLEEHIFKKEWFLADEPEKIQAEYKFWLPVRKVLST